MRVISFLFFCLIFCNQANAHLCGPSLAGIEIEGKTWNLGDGYAFEQNGESFQIVTPKGPVQLPAGHYANFHKTTAISRHPDAIDGHKVGFLIIAVNDGHLSHLLVLDAATGQKYRHRSLEGEVTSITPLPNSLVLLGIRSPNDFLPEDRGDRLELVDINIHRPYDKIRGIRQPTEDVIAGIIKLPNGQYRFGR